VRRVLLIARREFVSFFRSPQGYIIAALYLGWVGLDFNVRVLDGEKYSAEVLNQFFFDLSGATMFFSIFISMGLIARERETGTFPLLLTAPVKDIQVVLGKFLGAYFYLILLTLATIYMPMLVMVNGKVSWGHVFAGYSGELLLGGAALAIGTFGSSLTRSQIVAVFVSLGIGAPMVLFWKMGRHADKPLDDIFAYLALHNIHFSAFKAGKVHLRDIVYYLSVMAFFLFSATRILESRRWR
jgi:ABC-2 type transport system permease protein